MPRDGILPKGDIALKLFDLHCDTLTQFEGKPAPFTGHVTPEAGAAFEAWTQVFAIFVHDRLGGQAAALCFDRALAFYESKRAAIEAVCRPILALENAKALAGDLQRLDDIAAKGVKIITLTWNGENELGYGAACDPGAGLKPFGREALERMFSLGILPDVSHLNRAGFWDVINACLDRTQRSDGAQRTLTRPEGASQVVVATHSNCAAVQPHRRNLDDEQLRAVFACGGLVGINLHTDFLGGAGTAEDVARHLWHLCELGGGRHAALGSDFDGSDIHPSLAGLERMAYLREELQRLGFGEALLDGFFWGNGERILLK